MLIEIKEDIVDNAIEKKNADINGALDFLLMMALCVKQKKHIIFVPSLRSQGKKYDELSSLLGKDNAAALNLFNMKMINPKQLMKFLTVKAVVSYENQKNTPELPYREIWINPLDVSSFEPWVETFVLTENLLDSEFFSYIIRYYLKQNKFLKLFHTRFYALMGGGETIDKVLEKEIMLKQHFCLVLTDSDKKYPGGSIGSTANGVCKQMETNPFNCGLYVMEHVREIENLIPKKIVQKYGQVNEFDIFFKDPSFFDMKFGLRLSELYDDIVCNYWKELIINDGLFERRNQIKDAYPEKEEYDKAIKKELPLISGYGSNLLFLSLNKSNQFKRRLDSKNDLYSIVSNDLNTFQRKEWNAIGRELFSWTCCLSVGYF